VRRPVNAPGYRPAKPVYGEEEYPAQRPARRPQRAEYIERDDDDYDDYDYDDDRPRRGHGCLTAILVVVMIIALLVVGLMVWPEGDTGFIGTVNGVKQQVIQWVDTVKNMVLPEAKTPAAALDFKVMPASGQAPQELVFSLTTTKSVSGVSVVNQTTGETMGSTLSVATDNEEARIWTLSLKMEEAFTGTISSNLKDPGLNCRRNCISGVFVRQIAYRSAKMAGDFNYFIFVWVDPFSMECRNQCIRDVGSFLHFARNYRDNLCGDTSSYD